MLSFLKATLYVQIAPDRITIRNLKTGATVSETPELAVALTQLGRASAQVVGVGNQARSAAAASSASGENVQVVNPFAHPRSLVSDFTMAQHLLKALLRQALGSPTTLSLAPTVVMHPLGEPAGGFTQVENRAFHEMALGAGASEAIVWNGRVLSDLEIRSRRFPLSAGSLGG